MNLQRRIEKLEQKAREQQPSGGLPERVRRYIRSLPDDRRLTYEDIVAMDQEERR